MHSGFHEPEACYGLGVIVHALANTQNLLKLGYSERDCKLREQILLCPSAVNLVLRKEDWYHKAVEHVWATLQKLGEVPPEAKDAAQERLYSGRKDSCDSWLMLEMSQFALNLS